MAKDVKHEDILSLSKNAFDGTHSDPATSQTAFKAVANVLLLQEDSRQVFADAGYATKIAEKLHVNHIRQSLRCCR